MKNTAYRIIIFSALAWVSNVGNAQAMFESPESCCETLAKCKKTCDQVAQIKNKSTQNCHAKCEAEWKACANRVNLLKPEAK